MPEYLDGDSFEGSKNHGEIIYEENQAVIVSKYFEITTITKGKKAWKRPINFFEAISFLKNTKFLCFGLKEIQYGNLLTDWNQNTLRKIVSVFSADDFWICFL